MKRSKRKITYLLDKRVGAQTLKFSRKLLYKRIEAGGFLTNEEKMRKFFPSFSSKCTPTLYRWSVRYYCCSTISSSNLRRTVGFSLCSIDAFSPRLVLSPSLFPPRFTRETYTLHAIVHDDSVRIHVYACTRKAAPFAGDSESKRRRSFVPLGVLVILFFVLFRSFDSC